MRKVVRGLAGAAFLLISCLTFLSAEFIAGMTCDDVCSPDQGDPWSSYSNSPQWDQIAFLGWTVLLLGIACVVATRRGYRGVAGVALGGYGLACLGLTMLLSSSAVGGMMLLAAAAGAILVLTGRSRRPA